MMAAMRSFFLLLSLALCAAPAPSAPLTITPLRPGIWLLQGDGGNITDGYRNPKQWWATVWSAP
jgi:hypothetical protein